MAPRASLRTVAAALGCVALLGIGCASLGMGEPTTIRAASETPDRFLVGEIDGPGTSDPTPGTGCRNPMVDPRDGTRLTLDRSSEGQGDYIVDIGRYGARPGDLLRIDCATGQPIGLVRP